MPNPTQGGVPDGAFDAAVERLLPPRPQLSRDARRNEETRISVALEAAAPHFRQHFEEDLLSDEALGVLREIVRRCKTCGGSMEWQGDLPCPACNPDGTTGRLFALSVSREGGR